MKKDRGFCRVSILSLALKLFFSLQNLLHFFFNMTLFSYCYSSLSFLFTISSNSDPSTCLNHFYIASHRNNVQVSSIYLNALCHIISSISTRAYCIWKPCISLNFSGHQWVFLEKLFQEINLLAVLCPSLTSHLQQILLIVGQIQLQCNVRLTEFGLFYFLLSTFFLLARF